MIDFSKALTEKVCFLAISYMYAFCLLFLLFQQFPYPGYTTDFAMSTVALFMPLLVMLGLMYTAMTIIKV